MRYAAYGSNLHPLRLSDRIASAQLLGTSLLKNWSLHFHKRSRDDSGKCNIVRGSTGLHVAVYDISANDRITLDRIEGLGFGYSEVTLNVPEFGDCFSYSAEEAFIDDSLIAYDWYKEMVLLGARTLGFPEAYVGAIDAIPTRRDPDPVRCADQWSIVARLHSNE